MGYISTWMGDRLSSEPGMVCIELRIGFCCQPFINPSALLMSLMPLQQFRVNPYKTLLFEFVCQRNYHCITCVVTCCCRISSTFLSISGSAVQRNDGKCVALKS